MSRTTASAVEAEHGVDDEADDDDVGLAVAGRERDHVADPARGVDDLDHDQREQRRGHREAQAEQEAGHRAGQHDVADELARQTPRVSASSA